MSNKKLSRFSFDKLIRNNKLMMILSIVIAIFIWSIVNFVIVVDATEVVTAPIKINTQNITSQFGEQVKVYEQSHSNIEITVQGGRAKISQLTDNSFDVTPDYSQAVYNGKSELPLKVDKQNRNDDFEIIDWSPKSIDIYIYVELTLDISLDLSVETIKQDNVSIDSGSGYELGTPELVNKPITTENNMKVTVSGPHNMLLKIASIRATVLVPKVINTSTEFDIKLVPLDKDGNDLSETKVDGFNPDYITYKEFDDSKNKIRVPVIKHEKITPKYKVINAPKSFLDQNGNLKKDFLTISPSSLTFAGEPKELDEFIKDFDTQNTPVIDFNNINISKNTITHQLAAFSGVSEINGHDTIKYKINTQILSEKTFSEIPLFKHSNVVLKNSPQGYLTSLETERLTDLKILGRKDSISKIKAEDIQFHIDIDNNTSRQTFTPVIEIPNYDDVWVYWNPDNKYSIVVDISPVK